MSSQFLTSKESQIWNNQKLPTSEKRRRERSRERLNKKKETKERFPVTKRIWHGTSSRFNRRAVENGSKPSLSLHNRNVSMRRANATRSSFLPPLYVSFPLYLYFSLFLFFTSLSLSFFCSLRPMVRGPWTSPDNPSSDESTRKRNGFKNHTKNNIKRTAEHRFLTNRN